MQLSGFVAAVLQVSNLSHWSFNNAVTRLSKAIYLKKLLLHNLLFFVFCFVFFAAKAQTILTVMKEFRLLDGYNKEHRSDHFYDGTYMIILD